MHTPYLTFKSGVCRGLSVWCHSLRMDGIPPSAAGPVLTMSTTTSLTSGSWTAAAPQSVSSQSTTTTTTTTAAAAATTTITTMRQYGTSRLKYVPVYLDSDMRKLSFKVDLAKILQALGFKGWTVPTMSIEKVSGSLTNAVFFVHNNNVNVNVNAGQPTLLLRIYGPSTSSLISRRHELHMLHVLSTRYGIGPRVYGTFVNGRVEQYFDSAPLTPGEMRDPVVSQWIGRRMRELHGTDVRGLLLPEDMDKGLLPEEGVRRNVGKWMGPAKRVADALRDRDERIREIDLEKFEREWEEYWTWLMNWEKKHGKSERVFAHNDTQYGNLLKLKNARTMEDHKRIIVVDFEYASYNAAAFDIGNHFQEWMADYHSPAPHVMREEMYPNKMERYNFYKGYGIEGDERLKEMDAQVGAWSRASEGMWAVWGVVQAHSDSNDGDGDEGNGNDEGGYGINDGKQVYEQERERERESEGKSESDEFDYIGYALSRMSRFRGAVVSIEK